MCFFRPVIKEKIFTYNYMKYNLGKKLELLIIFHLHGVIDMYYIIKVVAN